jgi:hypothetical protein
MSPVFQRSFFADIRDECGYYVHLGGSFGLLIDAE